MMEKETRLLVRVVPCPFYRVPAMIDVNIEYDKGWGWISFYGTDLNRSTIQNIAIFGYFQVRKLPCLN